MLYFIYGIIFAVLGVQILESLADIFNAAAQWFVSFCGAHVAAYQRYIIQEQNEIQETQQNINAIGFQTNNESEMDE